MDKIVNDFALRTAAFHHNNLLREEYFDTMDAMMASKQYDMSALMVINQMVTESLIARTDITNPVYVMALNTMAAMARAKHAVELKFAA